MSEVKQILKLALPLLATQIVVSLMFFTDTVMASRASHVDMAAVSVATGIWSPIVFSVQGLLVAITPVVAQLLGANQNSSTADLKKSLKQGVYLALFVSLFVLIIFQFIHIPIDKLELETVLHEKSLGYLNYVIWGIVPTCLFFIYRGFCEGVGATKPALIVSVVGLVANIPLNYIFVFGEFGMPKMGAAGCGLATAIVNWISIISLLIYFKVSRVFKPYSSLSLDKPDFSAINNLVKIGTPISLALLFESSLFAFTALFIAPLGAIAVAGHQVAFSYSSVVFMAPLSLAMAATIRIGYLRGQGDYANLIHSIKTSFNIAFVFGAVVMVITLLLKRQIIAIYTDEPSVVLLASSILIIAAIYQLPDAIQVMAAGVFKGLKDTKPLFYITFIAYWPMGFALGYTLGRTDIIVPAMGAEGFWIGIVFGLSAASVMFLVKLRWTLCTLKQTLTGNPIKVEVR